MQEYFFLPKNVLNSLSNSPAYGSKAHASHRSTSERSGKAVEYITHDLQIKRHTRQNLKIVVLKHLCVGKSFPTQISDHTMKEKVFSLTYCNLWPSRITGKLQLCWRETKWNDVAFSFDQSALKCVRFSWWNLFHVQLLHQQRSMMD